MLPGEEAHLQRLPCQGSPRSGCHQVREFPGHGAEQFLTGYLQVGDPGMLGKALEQARDTDDVGLRQGLKRVSGKGEMTNLEL